MSSYVVRLIKHWFCITCTDTCTLSISSILTIKHLNWLLVVKIVCNLQNSVFCIQFFPPFLNLVSDAPYNLTVVTVKSTSFKLSWKFSLQEKRSPFQRFELNIEALTCTNGATTLQHESVQPEAEVSGLAPYTSYSIYMYAQHLIGPGFVSENITLHTMESGEWRP